MAARTRPLLMGVVNVTPDSFSDGGRWLDADRAVAHGLDLAAQGAELVDVGGESTRPGADRPGADEELARVIPVITRLVAAGIAVSVDTMRGTVARAAVEAGATVVNDVSGGLADPELVAVVAGTGVTMVAQHWRAHGAVMQGADHLAYADVVADVRRELDERLAALGAAGVREEQVVLDPGIGFSKTAEHNWRLLAHLDELASLGRPLLVGTSRKRFLGSLLADPDGAPRPADERDVATAATTLLAAQAGVWGLRVHDVRASADALAVLGAWEGAR
ncbi:dihydropteroate synthase [Arsenicicoccus dermatophilus]|uniref:dihydropteroate synthase n=1 Tax=Arsenicicoccus dermatophilus TaxID=1076331 RepID=UPI0039174A74